MLSMLPFLMTLAGPRGKDQVCLDMGAVGNILVISIHPIFSSSLGRRSPPLLHPDYASLQCLMYFIIMSRVLKAEVPRGQEQPTFSTFLGKETEAQRYKVSYMPMVTVI